MSELKIAETRSRQLRRQLLATVSSVAIAVYALTDGNAEAAGDNDRPTVWIELGGQLERVDGGQEPFAPPFVDAIPDAGFTAPSALQKPSRYTNGAEGKISFEPQSSDWLFSAAIRYGRSNRSADLHEQQPTLVTYFTFLGNDSTKRGVPSYNNVKVKQGETHSILDFQAGKDFGLGFFGREGTSAIKGGIRFAQFSSTSTVDLGARPDFHFVVEAFLPGKYAPMAFYHDNAASIRKAESFRGLGPSLEWSGTQVIAGAEGAGEFTFDWGLNAAALFGRQKVLAQGEANGTYHYFQHYASLNATYHHPINVDRKKSVVVPNVGGFAGISFVLPNSKVSVGYRADFFIGALDDGLETRHTVNRDFYGPFATLSIGLGG